MSITFIPLELYTPLYYYIILGVSIIVFLELQNNSKRSASFGLLLLIFVLLFMGLRPVSYYFGDMGTYAQVFNDFGDNSTTGIESDLVFNYFMRFSSQFMTVNFFFLICAFLYVFPLYAVCKKWFKNNWFYAFLMVVGSFSFWSYGTNGIRNGIATSLFLLGIAQDKRIVQGIFILLSIGIHKSLIIPTAGLILALFYNKPKILIAVWLLCIPLSFVSGGFWENFFAGIGFQDERLSYLTQGNINDDEFSSTGFRWDFLLYSATAVYAGWYFIVKKNFEDKIYFWLFNTYVLANAFWILVIRANFSNRFAYLSWFMISFVIVYPLLKAKIVSKQNKILAFVLMTYFLFTFIMNALLTKYLYD